MKIKILFVTLLLINANLLFSQSQANAIAKIKYQEAEEAFESGKFDVALKKLNNVEDLLGSSNSKILFLKILLEDTLLKLTRTTRIPSFKQMNTVKSDINFYIKNYYSVSDDKLAQTMKIAEYYDTIPSDYAEYKIWFDGKMRILLNYKKKIESEIEREEIYSDSLRKVLLKKQKAIGNRYLFAGIGFGALCYKSIKMAIKFKKLFNESPLNEYETDLDDKRDAWTVSAAYSGILGLIFIPVGLTPTEKVKSKSTVKYTDAISQSQQNIAELKGYLEAYSEYMRLSVF
jgi:hypothetical protein